MSKVIVLAEDRVIDGVLRVKGEVVRTDKRVPKRFIRRLLVDDDDDSADTLRRRLRRALLAAQQGDDEA